MYSSKVLSALMGKLKREVWQWEQGKEEKIQKEGYKKKQDKEKIMKGKSNCDRYIKIAYNQNYSLVQEQFGWVHK